MEQGNLIIKMMPRSHWFFVFGLILALIGPSLISAQGLIGITEPAEGDTIAGIVIISGTANDPNFMRYELAFRSATAPDWIVFAQGEQSVIDGTLAVWDTTVGRESTPVFPDGSYQLRLRIVRTDYNYDEYFVTNIIVSNDEPTPTPTATIGEDQGTPASEDPLLNTPQPAVGPLPSLTPFPTPLPRATPVDSVVRSSDESNQSGDDGNEGIFDQITSIDTSSFGQAFWRGVVLVALAFTVLAIYLVFRGAFRRIWRTIQTKIFR